MFSRNYYTISGIQAATPVSKQYGINLLSILTTRSIGDDSGDTKHRQDNDGQIILFVSYFDTGGLVPTLSSSVGTASGQAFGIHAMRLLRDLFQRDPTLSVCGCLL